MPESVKRASSAMPERVRRSTPMRPGVALGATKMAHDPAEEERAIADQRESTRTTAQGDGAVYGASVGTIEPYSIEHIPAGERHGRTGSLFWLWFAAHLTIADYALGSLPITLGVPLGPTVVVLLIGNVLGAALVGACAAMGIRGGYPQMYMGRR